MPEEKDEDFISIIEGKNVPETHLFFHGTITRSTCFSLVNQLITLDIDYKEREKEKNVGFGKNLDTNIEKERIILHLNSPGGSVSAAFIIVDTIESISIPIDCIVEGNLGSAGILILLACRNRSMQRHSSIFLHETVHGTEQLSFDEIRTFKEQAERVNTSLKAYYLERTSMSIKEVDKLLKDETILDYTKAKSLGFVNLDAI